MLTQNEIAETVRKAKMHSFYLLSKIDDYRSTGEDFCQIDQQFNIINWWISILEDYLINNYDAAGNLEEPTGYSCLSFDEILEINSKVKKLIGNHSYPQPGWVLDDGGLWRDSGFWNDSFTWHDEGYFE